MHLKTWVLGTFFSHGKIFLAPSAHAIHCVHIAPCVLKYLVFQTTMPQRSLSVYFSSLVPLLPGTKCEDVFDALLHFGFKDRITGHKRQKAYNEAQKARAKLFLSVPMATLCDFVAVAQKMATCDRKVRCLPHEFHAMQATVCARWAAQASLILTDKKDHCHGWAVSSVRVRKPPPPPALRAHLVTKGQWLPAIHMVAPKAPQNFFFIPLAHVAPLPAENFFHSPCPRSTPPRPGGDAPQQYP